MVSFDLRLSADAPRGLDRTVLKMRRPRLLQQGFVATPWERREDGPLGLEDALSRCTVPPRSGQWGHRAQTAFG